MSGVYISALEMFSIGIGPSSSHTVGPMRAAAAFVDELRASGLAGRVARYRCTLHGSLAATGIGHGTPGAVIAGLMGHTPGACDPVEVSRLWSQLQGGAELEIGGAVFDRADLEFRPADRNLGHPNAITLSALDSSANCIRTSRYFSIGGGFIRHAADTGPSARPSPRSRYTTMHELLREAQGGTIAELSMSDELAIHGDRGLVERGLDEIWSTMRQCIRAGLETEGLLPGRIGVQRRAGATYRRLVRNHATPGAPTTAYAMAVNEENAAGGRVVTAPTNGAAGIIPAVVQTLIDQGFAESAVHEFLLTACAVGSIIKANASISGAEVGCQGEVGAACAMAAAGACAVLGGSPAHCENAAEIALEHHLGLTCDPVGGLVQIPCIERNAVAAVTALTAAQLALAGDGTHVVSLDQAVETMRQTGADMSARYKETSTGGLAVNVPYC